jgi:hypothetical protein
MKLLTRVVEIGVCRRSNPTGTQPRMRWLAVLVVPAIFGAYRPEALACSPRVCNPGEVFPNAATLPENAVQWFVRRSTERLDLAADAATKADRFSVFVVPNDADAGAEEQELELIQEDVGAVPAIHAADERWVPKASVPPGTVLRVERYDACSQETLSARAVVIEAGGVPSTLGTLVTTTGFAALNLWTVQGTCTKPVNAQFGDVRVQLSNAAQPYADVLRYSLRVDGELYRNTDWIWDDEGVRLEATIGGSALGAGVERVFAVCDPYDDETEGEGVSASEHDVQMVALLPDGTEIKSDTVQLDLRCPTLTDAGADAAQPSDAAPPAATSSAVSIDAGADVAPPAPSATTTAAPPAHPKHGSGCSVDRSALVQTPAFGYGWVSALLGLTVCLRRVRRR